MTVTIRLDHSSAVYRSGDFITGEVIIYLKLSSNYKVLLEWVGNIKLEENEAVSGEEQLFKTIQTLNPVYKKDLTTCNFKFRIPANLPTSINISDSVRSATISYQINAGVYGTRNTKLLSASRTISVCEKVCFSPQETNSPTILDEKRTACFCCSPISFVLSTDKSSYVSGENIQFSALCTNKSNHGLKEASVRFIQIATFTCGGASQRYEVAMYKQSKLNFNLQSNSESPIKTITIALPPGPPTSLKQTKYLDISYELKFTVKMPNTYSNLQTTIPVSIGSHPSQIDSVFQSLMTLPLAGSVITKHGQIKLPKDDRTMKSKREDETADLLDQTNDGIPIFLTGSSSLNKPKYPYYQFKEEGIKIDYRHYD